MIWSGSFLTLIFLCLEASGQYSARIPGRSSVSHRNPSNEKQFLNANKQEEEGDIQKKMAKIEQVIDESKKEINILQKHIEDSEKNCEIEMGNLNKKHAEMMKTLSEIQKRMEEILRRIQEEEAEHIRLEAELKKLAEALQISLQQYEVIHEDLKLMEMRRSNGTTGRCNEITTALAVDNKNALTTRAYLTTPFKARHKKQNPDSSITLMKRKLEVHEIFRKTILVKTEELKRKLQSLREECEKKKVNINAIIVETKNTLEGSQKKIEELSNDLKESIAISETVRLEIKTGKIYVLRVRGQIQDMKKSMQNFKEDEVCFNNIKAMD